jgi:hypothetical protein
MLKKIEQLFLNFGVKLKSIKELENIIYIEDYNNNSINLDFHSFSDINQIFKYKSISNNFIFIDKLKQDSFIEINQLNFTDLNLNDAFNTNLYINVYNETASFVFSFKKLNRVSVPLNFIPKKMKSLYFEIMFDGINIKYNYSNKFFPNFAEILFASYNLKEKIPDYDISKSPQEIFSILRLLSY